MEIKLEVIDLRTNEEIRNQLREFKNELIDLIKDFRSMDDTDFEDYIIKFVRENRVHCETQLDFHMKELHFQTDMIESNSRDVNESYLNSIKNKLRKHSEKYPHLLFKVMYKPENPYDALVLFFKDGKAQECPVKIMVDDFDKTKLK